MSLGSWGSAPTKFATWLRTGEYGSWKLRYISLSKRSVLDAVKTIGGFVAGSLKFERGASDSFEGAAEKSASQLQGILD